MLREEGGRITYSYCVICVVKQLTNFNGNLKRIGMSGPGYHILVPSGCKVFAGGWTDVVDTFTNCTSLSVLL